MTASTSTSGSSPIGVRATEGVGPGLSPGGGAVGSLAHALPRKVASRMNAGNAEKFLMRSTITQPGVLKMPTRLGLAGVAVCCAGLIQAAAQVRPPETTASSNRTLTAVAGITVGHHTLSERPT